MKPDRFEDKQREALLRFSSEPPPNRDAHALRLDLNENTAGCSPAVQRALRRLSRREIAAYPDYERLRGRLARFFQVRPEELFLTNGADDALRLVFDACVEPGDCVLIAEPTFGMYRYCAGIARARVIALRYGPAMEFPVDAARRALAKRPRIFLLANPNNPTGTLLPRPDLLRIVSSSTETLVVADEAYVDFSGVTVLDQIRRLSHLIVVRTFSKAMGLAGLRLGCLFANRALAAKLRRAQTPFPVNAAALVAAEAAVRDGKYVRGYVREVREARREFEQNLRRLAIPFFPSEANFVLADFGPRAPAILRALRRQQIFLRDRSSDFGGAGFVRITIGTRAQMRRVARALEALWR